MAAAYRKRPASTTPRRNMTAAPQSRRPVPSVANRWGPTRGRPSRLLGPSVAGPAQTSESDAGCQQRCCARSMGRGEKPLRRAARRCLKKAQPPVRRAIPGRCHRPVLPCPSFYVTRWHGAVIAKAWDIGTGEKGASFCPLFTEGSLRHFQPDELVFDGVSMEVTALPRRSSSFSISWRQLLGRGSQRWWVRSATSP